MRKCIVICLAIFLVFSSTLSSAQPKGPKGASERAMEKASDEAIFHRVGDWFATLGKSDEEKARVRAERRAARQAKRAEKKLEKQKRTAEHMAQKNQRRAQKAMRKGSKK